jgi:hypothetical protein
MLDWLKGYQLPAGAVLAICAAGYFAFGYLHSEFVHAAEFVTYQNSIEKRILTEKQQVLEADKLKLEVKKSAYPQKFDAVDRALLQKYEADLKRVEGDLRAMKDAEKQPRK